MADFSAKVEWEGGVSMAMDYFGRDIEDQNVSLELVEAWAKAYDAIKKIEKLMPSSEEVEYYMNSTHNSNQ